jgi:hypothetical protein
MKIGNLYAEISLLSGTVIFGKSRNKKKKRRIELLYEILKQLILKKKFDEKRYII